MTPVNRIAYAVFETTDLAAQVDHYQRVMGLNLIGGDSKTAYLSAGLDHHTVVLQRGDAGRCVALGFQLAPGTDLQEYAKQVAQHGVQARHSNDSQPNIPGIVTFEDPKGTRIEVFADHEAVSRGPQWVGVAPNK